MVLNFLDLTDFYEILSIPKSADSSTIKTAYKKLAVRYHPDKNQNNVEAEDKFKQVNEAYQTLSDPIKKANYDYLLTYGFEPPVVTQNTSNTRAYYKAEKVRPIPRKLNFLYLYIFIGFALFILLGFFFFNYMNCDF